MPRERAKLTEKQERVLVQCQLMGLTPKDMQQISNRLIALEKEAQYKSTIADAMNGMSWTKTNKGWTIVSADGKTYECIKVSKSRHSRSWYENRYVWNIDISKPGTRFKAKTVKDVATRVDYGITAKICPDGSKDLFALLELIKQGRLQ